MKLDLQKEGKEISSDFVSELERGSHSFWRTVRHSHVKLIRIYDPMRQFPVAIVASSSGLARPILREELPLHSSAYSIKVFEPKERNGSLDDENGMTIFDFSRKRTHYSSLLSPARELADQSAELTRRAQDYCQ